MKDLKQSDNPGMGESESEL